MDELLADLCSGSEELARAALDRVEALGELALNPLLDLLDSGNQDHRWWATAAISAIDHPTSRDALLRGLSDEDPSVRQCAALGLREQPCPGAIPILIEYLDDPDRLLARLCGEALVVHSPESIRELNEASRAPKAITRIEAVRALSKIGDPSTIPALFNALEDPSPHVRFFAEDGLEKQGLGMIFFRP